MTNNLAIMNTKYEYRIKHKKMKYNLLSNK